MAPTRSFSRTFSHTGAFVAMSTFVRFSRTSPAVRTLALWQPTQNLSTTARGTAGSEAGAGALWDAATRSRGTGCCADTRVPELMATTQYTTALDARRAAATRREGLTN